MKRNKGDENKQTNKQNAFFLRDASRMKHSKEI
jgi:hypothetical protein